MKTETGPTGLEAALLVLCGLLLSAATILAIYSALVYWHVH